jgi:hypothetical protein
MKNDLETTEPTTTTEPKPAKSLDELIEILDQDSLRNVVGGDAARPKGSQLQ